MPTLIGADPELFVTKDGSFHSGHGIIPGNKLNPFPVPGGAIQVDGMALEFNIEPADTEDTFVENINQVLKQLRKMVPSEFHFSTSPHAMFSRRHFEEQPEEAKMLGCEPDFNAYTMEENPLAKDNSRFRTAAGHIHLGFTEVEDIYNQSHMETCATLVKQLDYFLGLPAIRVDSLERRALYGRAGSFRPKTYGVEYRVLSNFWLRRDKWTRLVYRGAITALNQLDIGNLYSQEYNSPEDIINGGDLIPAMDLLQDIGGYLWAEN